MERLAELLHAPGWDAGWRASGARAAPPEGSEPAPLPTRPDSGVSPALSWHRPAQAPLPRSGGSACSPRGSSLPLAQSKEQDPVLSAFPPLSIFAGSSPTLGIGTRHFTFQERAGAGKGFPVSADKPREEGAMALAGCSPGSRCRQGVRPNEHGQRRLPCGRMAATVWDGGGGRLWGSSLTPVPFPGLGNWGKAGTGTPWHPSGLGSVSAVAGLSAMRGCWRSQDVSTGPVGGSGAGASLGTQGQPAVAKHPQGSGERPWAGWGWPWGLARARGDAQVSWLCWFHSGTSVCPSTLPFSLLEVPSHRGGSGRAPGASPGSSGADSPRGSSKRGMAVPSPPHPPQLPPTPGLAVRAQRPGRLRCRSRTLERLSRLRSPSPAIPARDGDALRCRRWG